MAGLSTSSLRHHFDDRGRLLRYVLTRATRSFGPQGWIPAPGDPKRGRSMARLLLEGLLPLDEKRHRHAVVAGDLITAARTDPTLAAAAEGAENQLAELCDVALAWFRWETSTDRDKIELAHLQAVVDGLRRRLCDPHVPLDNDLARAVLQRHLDLMSDAVVVTEQTTADSLLTISVSDGPGLPAVSWTLTCDPPGGTHPDAAAAAAVLNEIIESGLDPFAPVPADMMCTQQYGGPETATITGTWRGRSVDASYNLTDGCEIGRWRRIRAVLTPPAG